MSKQPLDAIVVGAGLAGLTTALELQRSGSNVLVLEASERIGGRTRSGRVGGELVDCGGEWVGRRHRHFMNLVRRFDLHLEPARLIARPAIWQGDQQTRVGRVPRLSPREEIAFARALWRAKRLARRLDPEHPWTSPGAECIDSLSVAKWLDEMGVGGDAYRFFAAFIGALASAPIERMSLLHLLWWVRRGGGPLAMLYTSFQYRVREGTEAISRGLADELGGRIVLDAPVAHIGQTSSTVEIATANGERHTATRAIVAIPCNALPEIDFTPALPPTLQQLTKISNDPATKVSALLAPTHMVHAHFAFGGEGLAGAWRYGRRISGFAAPPNDQLPDDELIQGLAAAFQIPATDLQDTTIYRWREHPHIPGCDIAFAPGELTRLGQHLRAPHGRVHFAGAERGSWPNNIEGALESGHNAAEATLAATR
jgi:monoamine oxidase